MKKTNPLIDFYRKRGLLVDIDASPPIEEARKKVIPPCEKALSDIEKSEN
jgi:adenylate kinase family enzyme